MIIVKVALSGSTGHNRHFGFVREERAKQAPEIGLGRSKGSSAMHFVALE
ncbi:MAG: hypothetical protein ACXV3D_06505 [Halobacteriota archaeon]